MDLFNSIFYPVLSISGMGLIFGVALGIAGKLFQVDEDPKITEIREALPGANCAGCGFAGCDAFAEAVARGEAPVNGCPVGGSDCADKVADIMGLEHQALEKKTAYIKCVGTCEKAVIRYDYSGLDDCKAINQLAGNGPKACSFGCLGNGNCFRACEFGAVDLIDGIARINPEKCTACGKCIPTCPRRLIEMIPVSKPIRVSCNTWDNGKTVKANCSVGCIGCKICEKSCEFDAIHVNKFLAKVDYDKCTLCGVCVKKCPTKAIEDIRGTAE